MDINFWAQRCNASASRPEPELKRINQAANGVAISAFTAAAVFSATFFLLDYRLLRWRRSGKEVDGDRIWKNLRLFSGWMCAGCVAGAVNFAIYVLARDFFFEAAAAFLYNNRRNYYELLAIFWRYVAAYYIFYSVHLLCVIFAMSTLLRRVSDHASHPYYNTARDLDGKGRRSTRSGTRKPFDCRDYCGQYALYYWVRSVHKIAMVICSLNVVVRTLATGFAAEVATEVWDRAAAATDREGRDSSASREIHATWLTLSPVVRFGGAVIVSQLLEAAVLLLLLCTFLLYFPAVIIMFRRLERRLHALLQEMSHRSDVGTAFLPFEFSPRAADGSETQTEMPIVDVRRYLGDIKSSAAAQMWRFMFCLVLALIALLALAWNAVFVFVSLSGGGVAAHADDNPCGDCDPLCRTVGYIMGTWYLFTPELFPLVASLCSTLPLMFSLWLMTTPEDRELLLHPSRFLTEQMSLNPTKNSRETQLRIERARLGINMQ